MNVQEFFEQILSGKLTELDIYNHAQSMTDNFQDDKLNLLWEEYWKYINRGASRSSAITDIDEYLPEDPFEYNFMQLGILLSEKIEGSKEKDHAEAQSIFNQSSYSILDDKYMTEQGFSPLSVDEKLKYLNLWIKNAKQKRTNLKRELNSAQFYGASNPNEQEIEIYGEDGELSAYELKKREHQSNITSLKHKINRQNEVVEKLESELEYWQSQKDNPDVQENNQDSTLKDLRLLQNNLQNQLEQLENKSPDARDTNFSIEKRNQQKSKLRQTIQLVTTQILSLNQSDKNKQVKSEKNYSHQHINWLKKEDDSLEQFIEALQEHDLIEARETEAIIKEHFKPVREQNIEPEPIVWLTNQNLLVYLFRKLYEKPYYINPEGKKWELVSMHFIKKSGEQFKVRSLTVEANKQKDGVLPANGTNTIDKIVDRLITD